jgi:hypothetical protein
VIVFGDYHTQFSPQFGLSTRIGVLCLQLSIAVEESLQLLREGSDVVRVRLIYI